MFSFPVIWPQRLELGVKMVKCVLCLVVAVTLLQSVGAQTFFACTGRECLAGCRPLDCDRGRVIQNATACGCCPICIKPLEEGAPCRMTETAPLPSQECGQSLICINGTCRRPNDVKQCVREALNKIGKGSETAYGRPAPVCDTYGDYSPRRCKKGLICNCVDKEGNRIFGTALQADEQEMHCNCSRLFLESPTATAEQKLRCTFMGNFEPLQCSDTHCYCLRSNGQLDGEPILRNDSIERLSCYAHSGRKLDYPFTECLRARSTSLTTQPGGPHAFRVNQDPPTCDPDGSYAPKQCQADRCYCARADGEPYSIESYSVPRYSKEADSMTCNCLRQRELLEQAGPKLVSSMLVSTFLRQRCDRNGNYLPLQCPTSTSCRCVDDDGYQVSPDVMVWERDTLPCYKPEYDTHFQDMIGDLQ